MRLILRLLWGSILSLLGVCGVAILGVGRAKRLAGSLAGRVSGRGGAALGRRAARRAVRLLLGHVRVVRVRRLLDRLAVVHGSEASHRWVAGLLAWRRVLLHLRALRITLRRRASSSRRRLAVAGVGGGGSGRDVLLVLAIATD